LIFRFVRPSSTSAAREGEASTSTDRIDDSGNLRLLHEAFCASAACSPRREIARTLFKTRRLDFDAALTQRDVAIALFKRQRHFASRRSFDGEAR
jgi:hypothetical protein